MKTNYEKPDKNAKNNTKEGGTKGIGYSSFTLMGGERRALDERHLSTRLIFGATLLTRKMCNGVDRQRREKELVEHSRKALLVGMQDLGKRCNFAPSNNWGRGTKAQA